jgi:hypothetical protein
MDFRCGDQSLTLIKTAQGRLDRGGASVEVPDFTGGKWREQAS